jgi:hypothetical protein
MAPGQDRYGSAASFEQAHAAAAFEAAWAPICATQPKMVFSREG